MGCMELSTLYKNVKKNNVVYHSYLAGPFSKIQIGDGLIRIPNPDFAYI